MFIVPSMPIMLMSPIQRGANLGQQEVSILLAVSQLRRIL